MKKRRLILTVLLMACVWNTSYAEESSDTFTAIQQNRRSLPNFNADLLPNDSVYTSTTLPISHGGVATLGTAAMLSYLLYRNVDGEYTPNYHLVGTRPATEWFSKMSEYLAYSMPFTFLVAGYSMPEHDLNRNKALYVSGALFKSLSLTVSTTYLLKYSINRERPDQDDSLSFPSAHTSAAFAVATTLALNYSPSVAIPSFLAASAIGLSRFDLEKHYLSDIAAGAGIGICFALITHSYDKSQSRKRLNHRRPARFMPLFTDNVYGVRWEVVL